MPFFIVTDNEENNKRVTYNLENALESIGKYFLGNYIAF